jgi:Protein of unknown function (DUF3987)
MSRRWGGPRPASLYILTVSGSGDRKTTADEVALSSAHQHQKDLHGRYKKALREYEASGAGTLPSKPPKEATAQEQAAAKRITRLPPEPPRKPWLICKEPSPEGVVISLRDGQFSQGLFTNEGGSFIGGHAFSDEVVLRTIALLSGLWDGSSVDRVRAKDNEHTTLFGRRFSLHLMAQPEVATRLLGKPLLKGQGFLARLLIAAPQSLAGQRLYNVNAPSAEDDSRLALYHRRLAALFAKRPRRDTQVDGLAPRRLQLSQRAHKRLVAFYDDIERRQAAGGTLESVREWASKAAEHACRIAAVIALVEDPDVQQVREEGMRGAIELTQHYLAEYARLVGSSGASLEITRAQTLLDWLRGQYNKGHRTITPRKITQYGPYSIRTADVSRAALRVLTENHWTHSADGRMWELNPAVGGPATATPAADCYTPPQSGRPRSSRSSSSRGLRMEGRRQS